MSQDVSAVRRSLAGVSTLVKQEKFLLAAQALRSGAQVLNTTSLLRAEVEEFTRLMEDGCIMLSRSHELRKLFPYDIDYISGEEVALLDVLAKLIETLTTETSKNLEEAAVQVAARREANLAKGRAELAKGNIEKARKILGSLLNEFPNDMPLVAKIGESFLEHGELEDAAAHLEQVADVAPSPLLLNQLGIILRRVKRFEASEDRFRQAIGMDAEDANLHFNMGRLYLDQKRWKDAKKSARSALAINADFVEAQKMERYAQKMLEQETAAR